MVLQLMMQNYTKIIKEIIKREIELEAVIIINKDIVPLQIIIILRM